MAAVRRPRSRGLVRPRLVHGQYRGDPDAAAMVRQPPVSTLRRLDTSRETRKRPVSIKKYEHKSLAPAGLGEGHDKNES